MIEEQGIVTQVTMGRAQVQTQRSGACEGCGAKGACSCLGGGRDAQVWVEDPLGVRVGERVVVAVPEADVVKASFLAYLLPVVALVLGAVVGNHLAPAWGLSPDLGAAGLGLLAMAGAFLFARYLGGKAVTGPQIVRRV